MALESGKKKDFKKKVPNIVNSGYFRMVELKVFFFFFFFFLLWIERLVEF